MILVKNLLTKKINMKKLLIIAALSVFNFSNAQKGTILVQGNIDYSSTKNGSVGNNSSQSYFSFSPKVGYQFADNWTIGGELGISSQNLESFTFEYDRDGFSGGAFIRYSKPLSEMFLIYADFRSGYSSFKETNSSNGFSPTTSASKSEGLYTGITPALFINIKKGFGLNFNIGGLAYEQQNFDNGGNDFKNFNVSFGQSFSVGISKNF